MNKWIAVFCLLLSVKTFSQVNHQTGSAVFSYPVFSWQDDQSRLSAAVSINYNSGNGLKVNDVASNIGQGWNLLAGGLITRVVAGLPDDQKPYSVTGAYNDLKKYPAGILYNDVSPQNGCPKALTKYPIFHDQNVAYQEHNIVAADRELDRFYYNIGGRSGSFIIAKNNKDQAIQIEQNNLKIWFTRNENAQNDGIRTTINAFYIQDENGLIYKYGQLELTKETRTKPCNKSLVAYSGMYPPLPTVVSYESNFESSDIVNPFTVTGWYLSEISDPLTNRKIIYTYKSNNINSLSGVGIKVFQGPQADGISTGDIYHRYAVITYNKTIASTPAISSAIFPDGHTVYFNYGTERIDLKGAYKLTSIDIQYQTRILSKYELTNRYFVLNRIADLDNNSDAFQKSCARLCLQSIKKYSVDLKGDEMPTEFEYYIGSNKPSWIPFDNGASVDIVPPPFFHMKDIFGYYNGLQNVGWAYTTIPLYKSINDLNTDQLRGLCFTRRQTGPFTAVESGYAKNGLLKRINYPTGASLKYDYEQNTGIVPTIGLTNAGGVHVSQTFSSDGGYSNDCLQKPIITKYNYVDDNNQSSLWGVEFPVYTFTGSNFFRPEEKNLCNFYYKYPGALDNKNTLPPTFTSIRQNLTATDAIVKGIANSLPPVASGIFEFIVQILQKCFSNPSQTTPTVIDFNNDLSLVNSLPTQFSQVIITEGDGSNGITVLKFTSPSPTQNQLWEQTNPSLSTVQRYAPYAYGLPLKTTVKNATGTIVSEIENSYSFYKFKRVSPSTGNDLDLSCKCFIKNSSSQRSDTWNTPDMTSLPQSSQDVVIKNYSIYIGRAELDYTIKRVFDQANTANHTEEKTQYFYNSTKTAINPADNFQLNHIVTTSSDNKEYHQLIKYSSDYSSGILATLNNNNIKTEPVATISYFNNAATPNTKYLLSEKVNEYIQNSNGSIMPTRKLEQRFQIPPLYSSSTFYQGPGAAGNPIYSQIATYSYNNNGKLIGSTDEGGRAVANIYGYNDKFIIASVVNCNALLDKAAYTSFEDGTTGGFTISGTTSPGSLVITGTKSLSLPSTLVTITAPLNSAKPYTFSYWGTAPLTITGSTAPITGPTYNGLTYYEVTIPTGTTTLSINNSAAKTIDELRLYPKNARMRTATFDPLIGKTSECDENGRLTYYEYDELGRLRFIKDDAKNIVKMYEYNTTNNTGCVQSFANLGIGLMMFKATVPLGNAALPYMFKVPFAKYTSTLSQDDADLKAVKDMLLNSQDSANLYGTYTPKYLNVLKSQVFAKNSCPIGYTGGNVTYSVPAGTYTSLISQANADSLALADVLSNGQVYANTNGTCTISASPIWTATGVAYCEVDVNGNYTGYTMAQFRDKNPNSSTFNQLSTQKALVANDSSCAGVSKVNINFSNPTGTIPHVVFINQTDSLNFYDANFSGTSGTAGNIPTGRYNIKVDATSFNGFYSYNYQVGAGPVTPVSSPIIYNVNINAPITITFVGKAFVNSAASQSFTKNDCPAGFSYIAPAVIYNVPAGKYVSSISQADAQSQATADLTANGQKYANDNGVCSKAASTAITGNTSFSYGSPIGNGTITGNPGSTVTVTLYANGATVVGYTLSMVVSGVTATGPTTVTNGTATFSFVMPASGTVNWNASFTAVDSAGGGTISVN